jgi:2-methylcitrate dehydratase PrpD
MSEVLLDDNMEIMPLLITNVIDTGYDKLPDAVIQATKKQILDTLAVTIAGSTCSVAGEMNKLVNLVKGCGGKEESSIIAFGGKVPASEAAFINGILCKRRTFDDTHDFDRIHPSGTIVPTALAMAEYKGNISGPQLITAVALGYDLECRLKAAVARDIESEFGFVTGYLGAAATAGKILGLNAEKLTYALGRAFNQISGSGNLFDNFGLGNGIISAGIENGFATRAGIISALLADLGFTSSSDFLEEQNPNNLYRLFYNGFYKPWLVTRELGQDFRGSSGSQKAYPCCHFQQTAINAMLDLLQEQDINPEEISEIIPHLGVSAYSSVGQPLAKKQNPQNLFQAQFSICWGIASAIIFGEAGIKNFTEEALRDARIQSLAKRVFPAVELEYARKRVSEPALVEIKMGNGKIYSKRIDYHFGSPENPMNFEDIAQKFRHCCQYSVKPITLSNQDKVITMIKDLEIVNNISRIIDLVT